MRSFDCAGTSNAELYGLLSSVIGPRPICLASTVDAMGRVNLSPFSFFNLFSIRPPVVIFSPLRRMRDGSVKHALENVMEASECVVNLVDHSMVEQASLAGTEYPAGVNEFLKAGLTMLPSELVRPPRVAEARVQLECKVTRVLALGFGPGAGNLVMAEVLKVHVAEGVFGEDGRVDPLALDLVGRLGGDCYCRMTAGSLFELAKPGRGLGIGVDALPEIVVKMGLLSGNELGMLGGMAGLPGEEQMEEFCSLAEVRDIYAQSGANLWSRRRWLVELAQDYLSCGNRELALCAVLLAGKP